MPLIKDGRLRALAVSALTRLPVLPDVLPFAEASGAADFEAVSWHMLLAPAKTPREIVVKLHEEMKRIMSDKDMQQKNGAARSDSDRSAFDRGDGAIPQVREGKVERAGEESSGLEGLAVAPSV